jgi:nucleotide-binding universal stress UspA family protein
VSKFQLFLCNTTHFNYHRLVNEKMKILLAYDGSADADAAVADLKRAGIGSAAEVLVMTMVDIFMPPNLSAADDDTTNLPASVKRAVERAQQKLNEAKSLAKRASEQIKSEFPEWEVNYDAQADSPAWALIRTADTWQPDLIVMGARGHSVLGGRLILGSISQRVLYEARCTVRIARVSRKEHDGPVRIFIGVDRSVDSDAAVAAVCKRHWPQGSEVAVFAVVDTDLDVDSDEVREVFAPAMQQLRDAGLHAEVLVGHGKPADQILEEADTWGADCIFIGAKGNRGIDRLLLGSVSSAVSARADCSVEVVRSKTV